MKESSLFKIVIGEPKKEACAIISREEIICL